MSSLDSVKASFGARISKWKYGKGFNTGGNQKNSVFDNAHEAVAAEMLRKTVQMKGILGVVEDVSEAVFEILSSPNAKGLLKMLAKIYDDHHTEASESISSGRMAVQMYNGNLKGYGWLDYFVYYSPPGAALPGKAGLIADVICCAGKARGPILPRRVGIFMMADVVSNTGELGQQLKFDVIKAPLNRS